MIVALAISVAANVLIVLAFVKYLMGRDHTDYLERQLWANRVQAPETAISQTFPMFEKEKTEVAKETVYVEPLP